MLRRPPYRQYLIGSLLRGKNVNIINTCLRKIGLVQNIDTKLIAAITTKSLVADIDAYANAQDNLTKLEIATMNDVGDYIFNCLEKTRAWTECWDLISVRKYREYIFILASIPGYTHGSIADMFNKKFSRDITRDGIGLMVSMFWNVQGCSTLDIKNATDELLSDTLKSGINKLLFGNAVAAAKSVGISLKLNYSIILEEMLADSYLQYQEAVARNADADKLDKLRCAIMRIGDRVDKFSKRDTDTDVLHELLTELKVTVETKNPKLSDFLKDNEVI